MQVFRAQIWSPGVLLPGPGRAKGTFGKGLWKKAGWTWIIRMIIIDFSFLGQPKIMAGTLPTWKRMGLFYIDCVSGEVRSLGLGLWARAWGNLPLVPFLWPLSQFIHPSLPVFCPVTWSRASAFHNPSPGWWQGIILTPSSLLGPGLSPGCQYFSSSSYKTPSVPGMP